MKNVDAWQLLGLAPTDDIRAIKRAYATCLKRCRPEDDAQGFARLRDAYDYLLAQVGARSSNRIAVAIAPQASPVTRAPAPVRAETAAAAPATPQSPRVESPVFARPLQQVVADVLARARGAQGHDATGAFEQWLAANPELMLLDRKPLISRAVLAEIVRGDPPTPAVFAVLQGFFHWDDRLEQRRLAQAGLSIEAAIGQVEAAEMRRAIAGGVSRRLPLECGLEAARRAGDGWRAWWLAICRSRKDSVPALLQQAIKRYGYRAVEQVLGPATLTFWQRALEVRPTRLQWAIGMGKPLLLGLLISLSGLLGRLSLNLPGELDARDTFAAIAGSVMWTGLGVVLVGCLLNAWQLSLRWARLGPLPLLQQKWASLRRWLGLERQPWRALVATALLLVLAWFWPDQVSITPYLLLVGALLVLHLRDLRSVLGPSFAALGAFPLCSLHFSPLLIAGLMPPSLWLGNAIYDSLQRWRRSNIRCGNVVAGAGVSLAVLFLALGTWLASVLLA